MNLENSKISDPYRLVLNLTNKTHFREGDLKLIFMQEHKIAKSIFVKLFFCSPNRSEDIFVIKKIQENVIH